MQKKEIFFKKLFARMPKKIRNIASLINKKLRITENARAAGGGERLVIRSWDEAKKTKNFTLSHVQRYEWILPNIKGLHCLDIGCGCGYGTRYLAQNAAKEIVGIDISPDAIKFAKKYHQLENLEFMSMNALNLRFKDGFFDAIIALEVLEHLRAEDQYKFLKEITRVLKNNGVLFISSPNAPIHKGGYPFHHKELTVSEFKELLSKFYGNADIFGQDLAIGGKRQGKHWLEYVMSDNLSCQNFIITKDSIESCYGLLAICRNKK